MSESDTLAHANAASNAAEVPAYARVLPILSLCSSSFFAAFSVITWIALLTDGSYNVVVWLIIGLPASLGGSLFLAFLPTAILRFFVNDPRITRSLWISGVSATIGGGVWLLIAAMF